MFSKFCITLFTLCALVGSTFSAAVRTPPVEAISQDSFKNAAFLKTIQELQQLEEVQKCSERIEIAGLLHADVNVQPNEYKLVQDFFVSVAKVFENFPVQVPLAANQYDSLVTPIFSSLTTQYNAGTGFISMVQSNLFVPDSPTYLAEAIKTSAQELMAGTRPNKVILAHVEGEATFADPIDALNEAEKFSEPVNNKICVIATKPTLDSSISQDTSSILQGFASPDSLLVIDEYLDLPAALSWAIGCACGEKRLMTYGSSVGKRLK